MIIADTGYWLALSNRNDKYHKVAIKITENLEEPLITTLPVITEVCHFLAKLQGSKSVSAYLLSYADCIYNLHELSASDFYRASELIRKYKDLPMDFADASLVILAEYLGHGRILSTDVRDFKALRWKNTKPFKNILLSS